MKLNRDIRASNNILINAATGDFYDVHLHNVGAPNQNDRKEFKFFVSERLSPSSSSSSTTGTSSPTSAAAAAAAAAAAGGSNYIQHRVSKMDTLAGIAIMYGVEVTDIKRLNGFMTDTQMFALKSILIPMPGKHSPSPSLSKCLDDQCLDRPSEEAPAVCHRYSDLLRSSFQSSKKLNSLSPAREVSPAMTILQNFYGLKPPTEEKTVITTTHKQECNLELEDTQLSRSNQYLTLQRRSKSIDYNLSENGKLSNEDMGVTSDSKTTIQLSDKLLRRRQSSVTDFGPLKEDCSSNSSGTGGEYSAIMGTTGLALRLKASDHGGRILNTSGCGADMYNSEVRKSCSLSSFQDQDNNNNINSSSSSSSSMWSTSKWRLKSDLQAFSTAAISKPIFDGLPKPMVGRRNKAAID